MSLAVTYGKYLALGKTRPQIYLTCVFLLFYLGALTSEVSCWMTQETDGWDQPFSSLCSSCSLYISHTKTLWLLGILGFDTSIIFMQTAKVIEVSNVTFLQGFSTYSSWGHCSYYLFICLFIYVWSKKVNFSLQQDIS